MYFFAPCKRLNISHGDLKPDNIMINAEGEIKLGDFGESQILTPDKASFTGALAYWSPEKFDFEHTNSGKNEESFNVWSLGIITLENYLGENLVLKCIGKRDFYDYPEYINFFTSIKHDELVKMIRQGYDSYSMGQDLEEFIMLCIGPIDSRSNYEELEKSGAFRNIMRTMEHDGPGQLEVAEIVRQFIQRVRKPPRFSNEPSINKLKFVGDDKIYDFDMSELEIVQPNILPLRDTRRYYHKPTKTYISLDNKIGWSTFKKIKQEMAILNQLQHPNIVVCYGWCEDLRFEYICLEATDIDLFTVLRLKRPIFYENILSYVAKTLVETICYMNSQGYSHCNINPQTVLFNFDGTIKLSGFEYAWEIANPEIYNVELFLKEYYLPPERIFSQSLLDRKNDIQNVFRK